MITVGQGIVSAPYSQLLESSTFVPGVSNSVSDLSDVNFAHLFCFTTRSDIV